jgi:WD40 repeat protein
MWHVVVSAARGLAVTAALDGGVRVWRLTDLTPAADVPPHKSAVRSLAIADDGVTVATSSDDGELRVWPIDRPSASRSIALEGGPPQGLAFNHAGTTLAAGLGTGAIRLLDLKGLTAVRDLTGHTQRPSRIAFSPDDQLVASGSGDRTIRAWQAATGQPSVVLRPNNGTTRSVTFSPDGGVLLVPGWWRIDRFTIAGWQRVLPDIGTSEGFFDVAFSADGQRMVSVGDQGLVRLWSTAPPDTLPDWPVAAPPAPEVDPAAVMTALAAPQADAVFVAGRDQSLARLSVDRKRSLWSIGTALQAFVLAVSPDAKVLAAGMSTGAMELRDADSGALRATIAAHARQVTAIAFSPDSRLVASVGFDGQALVSGVDSGLSLAVVARRDPTATRVAFLDDAHLAVSWEDGHVERVGLAALDRYLKGNERHQRARAQRSISR